METRVINGKNFTIKRSTGINLIKPKIKFKHKNLRNSHNNKPQHIKAMIMSPERAKLDITKMQPLGDRILVKPFESESKTPGGILLPSNAVEASRDAHFGEVLSIGDDVKLKLSKNDKVIYNMYSSAKVETSGGDIVFLREDSIMGILE